MRRGLWMASLLVVACAGAQRGRVKLDGERMDRARELQVELRAPELFGRAEEARKLAEAAPENSPARLDHTSEARLWLEAAIAEAARIELSEQRLGLEKEVDGAEAGLVGLERQRAELAREVELRAAAALAEAEAQKALERASTAPRLRPKLSRAELTTATESLLTRAGLIQAALGTDDTAELQAAISEARGLLARDPEQALDKANAALRRALAVLGNQRASQPRPSAEEAASLAEGLRETGARVTRGDRGLVAVFEGAYAERGLKPGVRSQLARLCAVTKVHPHGAVRLQASGAGNVAAARMRELQGELTKAGCEGGRFGIDAASSAGDDLRVVWLGY